MRFKALALAALILAAPAAANAQTGATPPDALAREAIGKMVEALQGLIAGLPQYAAPEIDADGNITIRRLNPPRPTGNAPAPKDGGVTL